MGWFFLVIYLVILCMLFKADSKKNTSATDNFIFLSSILGIYQFLVLFVIFYNIIYNYAFKIDILFSLINFNGVILI